MKKFLLSLIVLVCSTLSVQASNWFEYYHKQYIDLSSIRPYKYGGYVLSNNYEFWIKKLNNGSKYFKDNEKYYNKKIWYSMLKYVVDCKEKKISSLENIIYDLNAEVIDSFVFRPTYSSVVPDTTGEAMYTFACLFALTKE